MKQQLRVLMSVCLSASLLTGAVSIAEAAVVNCTSVQQQTSLASVSSYTIYYGQPTAAALKKLAAYDMVVLESRLWTKAQVQTLQKNGVKVLGYLSILEQHETSSLLKAATADDYLVVDGQRHFRTEWNSWSMNINSAHYQALLIADYEQQIIQKGLQGVFLDTVGNVDDGIWPQAISDIQRNGVVSFVARLRQAYPQHSIMQNWGLGQLKDRTAPYLDGILWEDFHPQVVSKDAWSHNRMAELDKLEAQGLSVFTVKIGATAKQKTLFHELNRAHDYVGQIIAKSYDIL